MNANRLTNALHQHHRDEWEKQSGVASMIVDLNVLSLDNSQEIARRLGRTRYDHKPGWWVSGIDPRTGVRRKFGQFKPEEPFPNQDPKKKPLKYLSPSRTASEAIFLDTGDPSYWPEIIRDVSHPIVITEGAKKAAAGITAGIPTVALVGVWNGQQGKREGRLELIPDLALLAKPGRVFVLAFDADVMTNSQVHRALMHLAELLKSKGGTV